MVSVDGLRFGNTAISTKGTRIASGSSGNSRARRSRRRKPAARGDAPARTARVDSAESAMLHLFGQADAGVDIGVEDVDRQIDDDDHDPGFHDDALHQREVALKDALV